LKEINDIIKAYDKAVLQNQQTALATVVKVEGSSYRRPGARMLVTDAGELTGAISGGCLEGDAFRKAMLAIIQQKNKLVTYDTTDEDDAKLGIQLGCNGIVHILFEPLKNDTEVNTISLLRKIVDQRKNAVLGTVFNMNANANQPGTCCFINEEENIFLEQKLKSELQENSRMVLENEMTIVKEMDNNEVLFQFIPPVVRLVIVGAGNDAIPLMKIADCIGWEVVVADGRRTHATQHRFEKAKVIVTKPENLMQHFSFDAQTVFVLMTHNFNYDLAVLKQLISISPIYVGLLGPKEKRNRMLNELTESGLNVPQSFLENVYGPAGLDIGAETAEEIALSIVAEIKAVVSNKKGNSLRDKKAEIHERIEIQTGSLK
jgi:xanthine/CO dehydrogenase XdhC/CoxF family maturation factor